MRAIQRELTEIPKLLRLEKKEANKKLQSCVLIICGFTTVNVPFHIQVVMWSIVNIKNTDYSSFN